MDTPIGYKANRGLLKDNHTLGRGLKKMLKKDKQLG
jgi:hypothetical protein